MVGIVFKNIADKFWIMADKEYVCTARGQLKQNKVLVGDKVEFDANSFSITKVFERKNTLVRPPLANLDKLIIVISSIPKPDFMVVDKLILFSLMILFQFYG